MAWPALRGGPYGNEWGDWKWQVMKEEDGGETHLPTHSYIFSLPRGWIYFCLATKRSDTQLQHRIPGSFVLGEQ